MDTEDLELLERSLRNATEQHTGKALDDALDQLGWVDALTDDPRAAVATLFELQGRATASSSALDLVLARSLRTDGLTDAASTPAVVLPAFGGWSPPATGPGTSLVVDGLATAGLTARTEALVVAAGDGLQLATVPTTDLDQHPIEGVDPDLGLVRVSGPGLAAPASEALDPERWDDAIRVGRLALAHELIGVSRTMLTLAREHALDRVQFGQPISGFQAVRHRLAETLVAIETAEASVDAAWLDGSPPAAAMAKALAGRGARTAARHCQQVCAGIGFTTEHPLHRSIRRALTLDGLLGTAVALTRATGDDLVTSRRLPPLLPL